MSEFEDALRAEIGSIEEEYRRLLEAYKRDLFGDPDAPVRDLTGLQTVLSYDWFDKTIEDAHRYDAVLLDYHARAVYRTPPKLTDLTEC